MKQTLTFLLLAICWLGIVQAQEQPALFDLMTGSFSSEAQAAADSDYYSISLHMYPIWQESGQQWLYVEQALGSLQDRPYRQRVYLVEQISRDSFRSVVFTLDHPETFIGKWAEPAFFDAYSDTILSKREGCAVYLVKKEDGSYEGSTLGNGCESTLRGASYATSKVTIRAQTIESWDQGFNEAGEQVWGAEKGGYVFDRIEK
ncbi:MAG: chromophore lyase CpcT/CpeT [Bacteroidia bacterium]|nr:chromophore lyase CpcT/CpeT [Bacteroidia bacterium]